MRGAGPIDNTSDTIDSREVIDRIEYLEALDSLDDAERAELRDLRALAEEAEPYASDWRYGETLIRESHFERYAEELAYDCGMVPKGLAWPMTCIDWEQAARELQHDYTPVDFDGVTYYVRAS
jgi:hypothetical protein